MRDTAEIDKSFVGAVGGDENSESICRAIITLAQQLDKKVIAEGVEDAAQLEFLRRQGCEIAQGFLLSVPLSRQDFRAFVRNQDDHTKRFRALEVV